MPYKNGDTAEGRYLHFFVKFMNWKFDPDPPYDPNVHKRSDFRRDLILQITDNDVARYLCNKAYKLDEPGPRDNPIHARASSLEQHKKAISQFMINRDHNWDEVRLCGNPTKSVAVREVIKKVKEKEVQKRGAIPRKRRPLTPQEFEALIGMIEDVLSGEDAYFASAYYRYQFQMIARLDDTSKLRMDTFNVNEICPEFTILTQLCWSKNVKREGDAPPQMLFGCQDPTYCPLLATALWLEYSLSAREIATFVFETDNISGLTDDEDIVNRIKSHANSILNRVIKSSDYKDAVADFSQEGNLGSHSIRKYATKRARMFGSQKDDVDYRARWAGKKRQQDDYCGADEWLPLPDAKVGSVLCQGGAVGYKVRAESGISDSWILQYVVPNLHAKMNGPGKRDAVLVLGKALLWKVFEDRNNYVPSEISQRIRRAYNELGERCTLQAGENPVQKVPLVVYKGENDYAVVIEEELTPEQGGNQAERASTTEQLRFANSQIMQLRRNQNESRNEIARNEARNVKRTKILNENIRAVMREVKKQRTYGPELTGDGDGDEALMAGIDRNAKLSRGPKTIHALWQEYQFGLGTNKPAKDFTTTERGNVRFVYCRRKVVWDLITKLVNAGHSAEAVCDKIQDIYKGNMTGIIDRIRKDVQGNTLHPDLRISHL